MPFFFPFSKINSENSLTFQCCNAAKVSRIPLRRDQKDFIIIIITIIILFQVHLEKDKDLGSEGQTPPWTPWTAVPGAESARAALPVHIPAQCTEVSVWELLATAGHATWAAHTPKCWGWREESPPACFSARSCLHAHSPAIPKPPRRRCPEWTPSTAWKDQIPAPGIVLHYLSLETHSDLHSAHKPLNCSVSQAERIWGL